MKISVIIGLVILSVCVFLGIKGNFILTKKEVKSSFFRGLFVLGGLFVAGIVLCIIGIVGYIIFAPFAELLNLFFDFDWFFKIGF